MEHDPDSPPTISFQPPLTTTRRRTPPIDPVVLIILIPILALIFLYVFLPPILSHTSHIFKTAGSVKSTWDSLNIFLVIFAILCGVLARTNDDVSSSSSNDVVDQGNSFINESSSSNIISVESVDQSSGQWVGFLDQKVVTSGLRRNSSSYPDLRQDSVWEHNSVNQNRFLDDFDVHRSTPVSSDIHRRSRRSAPDPVEFSDVKEIVVDTFEVTQNTPVTPPPPPPPPQALSTHSKRHSFRTVGRKFESNEIQKVKTYNPLPPSPPPPPPVARVHRSRNKHSKLERKVSDATKEIATAISSLYNNQKKRKNKRKLRNYSGGSSDTSPPSSVHLVQSPENEEIQQILTPPPPPPPPPPSMFQNLFKKGGKHKRIHSVPVTASSKVPPPPPPPPPSSIFNNIFKSSNKSKRFQSASTVPPPPPPPPSSIMNNLSKNGTKSKCFNSIAATSLPPPPPPPPRYIGPVKSEPSNRRSTSNGKPPLPTKTSSYYDRDDFLKSGSQSPLIPMPPPPPPFRIPAMTFELRGDFVRIRSSHSSVCSSPDREEVDLPSTIMDGGDLSGPSSGSGPISCPSPDVNAKADSFISRLKDEWRIEKINYVKEKLG